jgi:hypothetical protein
MRSSKFMTMMKHRECQSEPFFFRLLAEPELHDGGLTDTQLLAELSQDLLGFIRKANTRRTLSGATARPGLDGDLAGHPALPGGLAPIGNVCHPEHAVGRPQGRVMDKAVWRPQGLHTRPRNSITSVLPM